MKGAYVYLISFFLAAAAFSQCGQSPGNGQGSDTTGNQGGAQGGAPGDTTGNQGGGSGGAPMDTSGNQGTDTSGAQGGGDYLDIQNNDTTGNHGMDTTGGQGNQGQGGQGQMPGDTTGNQNGQGQGGQTPSDTTGDQGKTKMIDTVRGTVDSIDTTSSGPNSPVTLTMTSQLGQTYTVVLGPQSFLKEMNFSVKKGDTVQVIGTPSQSGGKNTITAYQVRKGQTTLLLRDENGTPLWSGKGRP